MTTLDTIAIAHALGRASQDIRNWARRGKITKIGHDSKGRTLYHLESVTAYSDTLPPTRQKAPPCDTMGASSAPTPKPGTPTHTPTPNPGSTQPGNTQRQQGNPL